MIISPEASVSGPSTYRLERGTKLSNIPSITPALSTFNSPFQLAEYLAHRARNEPHNIRALVEIPSGDEDTGGKPPERDVWIYEHLRRIPIDLTPLLIQLLGSCSRETCPQMKADEWLYLCVAHGGSGTEDCCAIDYILHTLDTTTALLSSSKSFPSRLNIPQSSLFHFPSLFRRLSRIFSHAYYHHREAFSMAESETSLYARFVGLCERYDLVGTGLLVIPREALHESSQAESKDEEEEADEENEVEDDDGEEDGAIEEDSDEERERDSYEDRGRETKGVEKRTQSLDRGLGVHAPLPMEQLNRDGRPKPSANLDAHSGSGSITDERGSLRKTTGFGTMGRGKQPRGTMLWTSDAPTVPDLNVEDGGYDLSRTVSIESIMRAAPEKGESIEDEVVDETEPVPKDEIDLLEEQGRIPPEPSVAPLFQPGRIESVDQAGEDEVEEGMHEVELDHGQLDEQSVTGNTERNIAEELDVTTPLAEAPPDLPVRSAVSTKTSEPGHPPSEGVEVVGAEDTMEVDRANDEAREAI